MFHISQSLWISTILFKLFRILVKGLDEKGKQFVQSKFVLLPVHPSVSNLFI